MNATAPVLIAGCGYVGTRLAELLAASGQRAIAVARTPRPRADGITPLTCDLADPDLPARLPSPLHAMVFAAGRRRGDGPDAYTTLYREAFPRLLEHLERQQTPRPRILLVSTTGVYGPCPGQWVDEETPPAPERPGPRAVRAAEERLRQSPLPGCSIRLSGIYGPGRTRLIDLVRAGRATYDPALPEFVNHIHREDASRLLHHLLHPPAETLPPVLLGTDHDPVPRQTLLAWLAQQTDAPTPRAVAGSHTDRPRSTGKRCRSRYRDTVWMHTFRYPTYKEGYRALLGTEPDRLSPSKDTP